MTSKALTFSTIMLLRNFISLLAMKTFFQINSSAAHQMVIETIAINETLTTSVAIEGILVLILRFSAMRFEKLL
jgi:hypothetical protein